MDMIVESHLVDDAHVSETFSAVYCYCSCFVDMQTSSIGFHYLA